MGHYDRGLSTPIVEKVGYIFNKDSFPPLVIKSIVNAESLVTMIMINHTGDTFDVMVHDCTVIYFPNHKSVRIDIK